MQIAVSRILQGKILVEDENPLYSTKKGKEENPPSQDESVVKEMVTGIISMTISGSKKPINPWAQPNSS